MLLSAVDGAGVTYTGHDVGGALVQGSTQLVDLEQRGLDLRVEGVDGEVAHQSLPSARSGLHHSRTKRPTERIGGRQQVHISVQNPEGAI
jgi:hypothetical protein